MGTCCLFLPLKFGVGLISMYIWLKSLLDIMSLMQFSKKNQIRFMAGGYDMNTFRMNAIYGSCGIVIGFLGLLGTFDDKANWIKIFAYFVYGLLVFALVVFFADWYQLSHNCVGYAAANPSPTGLSFHQDNPPLYSLSSAGICSEALNAYILGFVIEFAVNVYFAYCVYRYSTQIENEPPYSVDFAYDKTDRKGRWDFYRVNEVPFYANQRMQAEEGVPLMPTAGGSAEDSSGVPGATYGAVPDDEEELGPSHRQSYDY